MATESSGESFSVWMDAVASIKTGPLDRNLTADVCVIGGGIAGLSTAYNLQKAGRSVILLESSAIGSGETSRTTAHFSYVLDDRYQILEKSFGKEGIRLAAESHMAAINWVENVIQKEVIECDFQRVPGYLFLSPDKTEDFLEEEFQAAHRAGLSDIRFVERAPLPFDTGPCILFPNQAQLHPMKYLTGLTRAFLREEGQIFTDSHVESVEGGHPCQVHLLNGFDVDANSVVVATNTPINDRVKMHTKQAPYRTYVVAAQIPKASIKQGLYWDTQDPYHYVRLQEGEAHDILIVGGEDHKTGQETQPEKHFAALEDWMTTKFPMAGPVGYRWSGQVLEPVDGMAFIGRNPGEKNIYIVTGDSGNGMTHGSLAALLITDLINEKKNSWAPVYDPSRKPLSGTGIREFVKENLNVAKQYLDWLSPADLESVNEMPLHSGTVIRSGTKKIAVYKDTEGKLHECSAVCPHLNCIVRWNSVEASWDCPCHGSRFDPLGEVLSGPAVHRLAPIDSKEVEKKIAQATKSNP